MLWPVPTPRRSPRASRSHGPGVGPAALLLAALGAAPAAAASPQAAAPAPPQPPAAAPPAAVEPASTAELEPPVAGAVGPAANAEPGASAPPTVAPTEAPPTTAATRPPRVDGPYIGASVAFGESFARVNNFATPNPLSGGTMGLRFGEAIFPWMTIGLEITGTWANRFADPRQRLLQGAAVVDFGFLPIKRVPVSFHVGFGAGGGAVREAGRAARSGFGGAVFTGAVRYEIFPLAERRRPRRGGGFSLGPELGWLGFTPAAKGRPMSNTIYLGLFLGFYFGS